jgi:hypothetical protein
MTKKNNNKSGIIQQIAKRFETTIIGSIARFEDSFGYLWGIDENNPTPEQTKFLEAWDFVRTSILNHGNNQMRQAIDEVIDYLDNEKAYKYHILFKNPDNNHYRKDSHDNR